MSLAVLLIGSALVLGLLSSGFANSYAQSIIGYSESTITVKSKEAYCSSRTLQLTDLSVQVNGEVKSGAPVGSQLSAEVSVTSNCEISNYPIIILFEVRSAEGATAYLAYQNITMSEGEQTPAGFSWTADKAGDYTVRVFAHACLPCSGDFGLIKAADFTVS